MAAILNILAAIIVITFIYSLVEIGFALKLDSLALLSDGFHNLSDCASIYLAWFAERAKTQKADLRQSFGFVRADHLGALANVSCVDDSRARASTPRSPAKRDRFARCSR